MFKKEEDEKEDGMEEFKKEEEEKGWDREV